MLRIGLLAYGRPPASILPPRRIRALLAEAALQDARILLVESALCDAGQGIVRGLAWADGGFQPHESPPPDVIITANLPLDDAEADQARWLQGHCPFIADPGPDKLTVSRWLADTGLAEHVIPFVEISSETTSASLRAWLSAEGSSVVKTAEGKRGSGLHFVEHHADGSWTVRHDAATLCGDLDTIVAHVARRIAGRSRYRRYLAQRYIASRSPDGRAVDLRVHVQRDGHGRWQVTRAYVRLGEHNLPMSNVSRGGYQGEIAPFLAMRCGDAAERTEARLQELAMDVARAMEAANGGPISELGVDVAIDPANRLWLIEANTYPGTSLHEQDRAVHTIAYARHVARTAGAAHAA